LTNLKEPMFTICANPHMRIGYCALVVDDQIVYAGLIREMPGVFEGAELFLHPKDADSLEAHIKKRLH